MDWRVVPVEPPLLLCHGGPLLLVVPQELAQSKKSKKQKVPQLCFSLKSSAFNEQNTVKYWRKVEYMVRTYIFNMYYSM
jgi:hypothetical protein